MAASWLHAPKTCPVYVTYSHISQSPFSSPHLCHCPLVSRLCVCPCVCWFVCLLVDVCVSCPSLLPPPPRRLGVCTPPTVLVPTSEPPGTTIKAPSPPSGMYPHHLHLHLHLRHCPPPPSDSPQTRRINTTQKRTNQLFLFLPPHLPFSHFLPNLYVPPSSLISSHTLLC